MTYPPPSPLRREDYEAIEAAVMETERGRWFLAEYARRNRNADTVAILTAIDRIEGMIAAERAAAPPVMLPAPPAPAEPVAPAPVDDVVRGIADIERAIAETRAEIASLAYKADARGPMTGARGDLASVVADTERATQEILAAAERVQEIAWTLREAGVDMAACDALDARATDIYLACSFQDLTGQRIARVVETLSFVQARVADLVEALGLQTTTVEVEMPAEVAPLPVPESGPAPDPQARVDTLLDDDDLFEARPVLEEPDVIAFEEARFEEIRIEAPVEPAPVPRPRTHGALALAVEPVPVPEPRRAAVIDFAELAFAEKVALFS